MSMVMHLLALGSEGNIHLVCLEEIVSVLVAQRK